MKSILVLLGLGLAVGIGGGLVRGELWFHGGEVVVIVGLAALYGYAIWKNPQDVAKTVIDGDSTDYPTVPASRMYEETTRTVDERKKSGGPTGSG